MAGAQAQTVSTSSSSLLLHRSTVTTSSGTAGGNVLHHHGGPSAAAGLPQHQQQQQQLAGASLLSSSVAARRSQLGGVNMLAGFSNNPLLNGVSNPGLTGELALLLLLTLLDCSLSASSLGCASNNATVACHLDS